MTDNQFSADKVFHCPTFLLLRISFTICQTVSPPGIPPLLLTVEGDSERDQEASSEPEGGEGMGGRHGNGGQYPRGYGGPPPCGGPPIPQRCHHIRCSVYYPEQENLSQYKDGESCFRYLKYVCVANKGKNI